MHRRDILRGAGSILASLFVDVSRAAKVEQKGGARSYQPTIDAHCHLFNGSDLPTVRFIKIVILHYYPKQGVRTLDIRDADALDGLIALFTWIVGRTRAPSALEEIRVLDGTPARAANANLFKNQAAVIDATAAFIAQSQLSVSTEFSPAATRTIRSALFLAAGESGAAVSDAPLSQQEARRVAEKAFRSKVDLGVLLRWFALFTRYRYALSDELASAYKKQGFEPVLLCPAMIDYDLWLGENVDKSPLPSQVSVMGRLARRRSGPVVHGYVGFDPLRQAYFSSGAFTAFDPLGLVRRAIADEGFLGVKLYPPMGFKPIGNAQALCQTYPERVVRDLTPNALDDPSTSTCNPRPADGSAAIGDKLDKALSGLFDLCVAESACVIAHAAHSNEASKDYSARADPAFWITVFERWPSLRVALAHFGGFETRSASAPAGTDLPEASWEWTFGRYLKQVPNAPVFADISYLTEISNKAPDALTAYVQTFKRWISLFDPECQHLMFGTDWTMLGIQPEYEGYTARVYAFFSETCGLTQTQLDRLFYRNAGRFLGLREGDSTRARLLKYYDRHKIPRSRLPLVAAQ